MKIQNSLFLGIISLLISPYASFAATVTFTTPWNFSPSEGTVGFGSSTDTDFGSTSSPNAVVKARAEANRTGLTTTGIASSTVTFERDFMLSGSPKGWDVRVSGALTGNLFVDSPDSDSQASVVAFAGVMGEGIEIDFGLGSTGKIISSGEENFLRATSSNGTLNDGTYTIVGGLQSMAKVGSSTPGGDGAVSDFFNTLTVKLDAKRVPEPLTILASTTALGVGAVLKRKYSKRLKKAKAKVV